MTADSYLMSVTTSKQGIEVVLAILNTAGNGQSIHGYSNGIINKDLWIIPKGKGNRQQVISQLQSIPAILNVSIVALSKPVNANELIEVRELFAQHGWDANNVTDETLSLFINANLQGQYIYFIHYDLREKEPFKIKIKPIEEHPDFSPDWLKAANYNQDDAQDREFTIEDFLMMHIEQCLWKVDENYE